MGNSSMIRVAVVVPKYGLIGGAESVVFELTERIAMMPEFEVHLFANKWQKGKAPVVFHHVPIISFPRWAKPVSFAWFAQLAIRRAGTFDLLHSHERLFEMDLFTFHGIPHKTWITMARRKQLSLFDRATAWVEKKGLVNPRLRKVLPVSTLVRDELFNLYNTPESKVHVIHPGISEKPFLLHDKSVCREEIRRCHGFSEDDVVLLFVGMNFEIKRLDFVLRAVAHWTEKKKVPPHLKLLVVGKGNRKGYLARARRLGIGEQVVFAGVTREVEKYFLAADIFAMPSQYDTFGLVVLEAMVAGLPVIVSDKVGSKDLIDSGINGFVLEPGASSRDMATVMDGLMDRDKRDAMGESARNTALRKTWDKMALDTSILYKTVGTNSPQTDDDFQER
jgi:UDP-glucose:(heptosyl)LPS alpha-1,3-glucosyltransferase